jgi:hypothetical protein
MDQIRNDIDELKEDHEEDENAEDGSSCLKQDTKRKSTRTVRGKRNDMKRRLEQDLDAVSRRIDDMTHQLHVLPGVDLNVETSVLERRREMEKKIVPFRTAVAGIRKLIDENFGGKGKHYFSRDPWWFSPLYGKKYSICKGLRGQRPEPKTVLGREIFGFIESRRELTISSRRIVDYFDSYVVDVDAPEDELNELDNTQNAEAVSEARRNLGLDDP